MQGKHSTKILLTDPLQYSLSILANLVCQTWK